MSNDQEPRFRFEHQLRLEADRILDDPLFRRAPTQSALLKFLVERTISTSPPPSQYEIAVDCLGKSSNFDSDTDSYPRVQVSRLRRNLDDYYARIQPANGRRIAVCNGSYRLKMSAMRVPVEGVATQAGSKSDSDMQELAAIRRQIRLIYAIGFALCSLVFAFGAYWFIVFLEQ